MGLFTSTVAKGETVMAEDSVKMVEATLRNDNGENGTIQIRSTDVERMKKVYGDRLTLKKAPAAKNKKVESESTENKSTTKKSSAKE